MVEEVIKKWGSELIIHNDDGYCGKILKFKKDAKFSMHFHVLKRETWYVNKGLLAFVWIDTETANRSLQYLNVGDVIEIERYKPHQLTALEESEIFEVSTTHYDSDSYRIAKGDSQTYK
jgi:mannose-6-phosphate isomerase-like protein (cupin superfamily)